MAIISAFKGLRYNTNKVSDLSLVTTPPYDVISYDAQEKYYSMHPDNIIRVELGKDSPDDNESNNKYTRSGSYIDEWINDQILVYDEKPCLYIYEQDFNISEWEIKTRRGLVALVKLAEFSEGVILPHETTLSKAKTDRFNLMDATHANISQIFSLYNDENAVSSILQEYTESHPCESEFENQDGITERIWAISDMDIIQKICNAFSNEKLFIADGHHRYETALNFRNKEASSNPTHTGAEPYNYVMMTLVDMNDPGLIVFPTHRVLKDLPDFNSSEFLEFAKKYFNIDKIEFNKSYAQSYVREQIRISLEQSGEFEKVFGYYDALGDWYYILSLKNISDMDVALPDRATAYKNLDVTILHTLILDEFFKIDAENMANQINLSYTREIKEALDWVNSRRYNCAFFLNPTKVDEIKEIALSNEIMPQKSTYFYPKLTTGLVMHKF